MTDLRQLLGVIDSVDRLLADGGYAADASARRQLSIARSIAGHLESMAAELQARVDALEAENAELRASFTKLDQPRYKGDPMLDAVLSEPDPEFRAAVEALPARYWARYDLSAARMGWAMARGEVDNA